MSWLDGTIDESEALSQTQRLTFTDEMPAPGFWKGSLDVIGPGFARGSYEGAAAIESGFTSLFEGGLNLAAAAFLPEPRGGGTPDVTSAERSSLESLGKGMAQVEKDLRPDAASVGTAGQILSEVLAIIPRTAAATMVGGPIAGAVAAGAPAGYASKQAGMHNEGLDESTATLKGVIDTVVIGGGALMPAARFVKPILPDLGITVAANVGLGVASRAGTKALLEGGGYTAQAAQYQAMDAKAMTLDAVLGAAFFGVARLGASGETLPAPSREHVDAALTENNARHFDVDTAPGIPATPRSAAAHHDALRQAVEQIQRGEPVTLHDGLIGAEFVPRASDEHVPVAPKLEDATISAREELAPAIRAELEQQAAAALPNVKDLKGELSTLQRTLDGLDATFRDRSKAFQEQGMSRKQAETAARKEIVAERKTVTEQHTAISSKLDGNRKAEQARTELNTMGRGELPAHANDRVNQRAEAIVKGFEKKPLAAGVQQAAREPSMAQVARQEISRILDDIERLEPAVHPKPLDIGQLKDATNPAGNAPKAGKDATNQAKPLTEPEKAAPAAANDAGQPKAGKIDSDPVFRVADEILARTDDIHLPTGAMDADGNPVTVSARQMLAEADADIQRAQSDSAGYEAAAACFLQRGL